MTSEFGPDQIDVMTVQQQLAFAAYRIADAMLAERAKVPA